MPNEEKKTVDPVKQIRLRLGGYFKPDQLEWKPQSVSKDNNRALAICYIDARAVMKRLDDVLGIDGWEDSYEVLPDGCVVCTLRCRICGQWVTKQDVGGESEQKDTGDKRKASFSDAFKRAAVKFGVGRYLYSLPSQWVDYDSQKRHFVKTPQLPAWALPKREQPAPANSPAETAPPPATNGSSKPPRISAEQLAQLHEAMRIKGVVWGRIVQSDRFNFAAGTMERDLIVDEFNAVMKALAEHPDKQPARS